MGKIAAISALVVLLGITGADADIVELDLFDLGCQEFYDFDSPYWTTDFDLGVPFTEISNVYVHWSGEITAGLAVEGGSDPFPLDVGIGASLGSNPYLRSTTIWGGEATYPDAEAFGCQSEFELVGNSTWSDLLDGQGTIIIEYTELVSPFGIYVEHGFIALSSASLIVDGVPVPEPTAFLFIIIGVIALRVKHCNKSTLHKQG